MRATTYTRFRVPTGCFQPHSRVPHPTMDASLYPGHPHLAPSLSTETHLLEPLRLVDVELELAVGQADYALQPLLSHQQLAIQYQWRLFQSTQYRSPFQLPGDSRFRPSSLKLRLHQPLLTPAQPSPDTDHGPCQVLYCATHPFVTPWPTMAHVRFCTVPTPFFTRQVLDDSAFSGPHLDGVGLGPHGHEDLLPQTDARLTETRGERYEGGPSMPCIQHRTRRLVSKQPLLMLHKNLEA